MTETNALAVASEAAPSSDQTLNDQSSPETTPNAQTEPEATEGEKPEAAEGDAPEKSEGAKPEADKRPSRSAERISQLVRERNEAEVRAFAAEQKLKQLRRPIPVKEDAPQLYRDAAELRNAERGLEAEETAESLKTAQAEVGQLRFTIFSEKVGDPAVVEAFCKLPRVSVELADLVTESEHAKALATRLANNPVEARRLSNLPPHRLGAELARMEADLSKQPPVRRVSQAPEPSTHLKGGSSPAAFDPHTTSTDGMAAQLRKAGVIK